MKTRYQAIADIATLLLRDTRIEHFNKGRSARDSALLAPPPCLSPLPAPNRKDSP